MSLHDHVRWVPTSHETYIAVYREHASDFTVFGSHTCDGGCPFDGEPTVLTEWGFKDAGAPTIKSIGVGPSDDRRWTYFIALIPDVRLEEDA